MSASLWNYRVVKHADGTHAIHECYYGQRGDDIPHSITERPVWPVGDDLVTLRADLERMLRALAAPVLDDASFDGT